MEYDHHTTHQVAGLHAEFATVSAIADDLKARSEEFRRLSETFSGLGKIRELLELHREMVGRR
ncbi:MAG: hypothetical protein AAGF59_07290 [Pseudomonadota bacterium]